MCGFKACRRRPTNNVVMAAILTRLVEAEELQSYSFISRVSSAPFLYYFLLSYPNFMYNFSLVVFPFNYLLFCFLSYFDIIVLFHVLFLVFLFFGIRISPFIDNPYF